MAAHQLALASIRTDGGTQSRAEINTVCVAEYAADMEQGAEFPPVVVFYDGKDHWLADGFHRVEAVRQLDKKKISADVRQGTVRDAILFSLGANGNHGLRRTNADKRRAVLVLLGDDEWRKKSDRWIAKACGVSADFSSRMRREQVSSNDTSTESRTGMDGKEYPVKPCETTPLVQVTESTDAACPNCGGTEVNEYGDCAACKEPLSEPVADKFDTFSAATSLRNKIAAAFLSWPIEHRPYFISQLRQVAEEFDDPNIINAESL